MTYLLFSRSNKIGSRLIRAATWSEYSHVDLILPSGMLIGALIDRGVCEYPLTERLSVSTKTEIRRVGADEVVVAEFLRSQIGKRYDFTALLGLTFHRDWQEDSRWFCSELLAAGIEHAGVSVVRKSANRVTPQNLLESPMLLTPESSGD